MSTKTSSRREFLKSTASATGITLGLNTIGAPAILSARGVNDKIRVGFIGVGNRGTRLLKGFLKEKDCMVAALCDVYEPYLNRDESQMEEEMKKSVGNKLAKMTEKLPENVKRYKDFRRLLEQKDIDAVCIASPDHWHALQTIQACEAGKDIYVEKPLTATIVEGRKMINAAKKCDRIVQVGLHRRSSNLYRDVVNLVQSGKIGKVTTARAFRISNMSPYGIGVFPTVEPPKFLNWDMWLGPRPLRPFQYNLPLYKFRWWKNYSSQMGNWGVHYCDAVRWVLNEEAPISISAHGGQYAVKDDRTIPDTMEVIFEFASGKLLTFAQYEASGGPAMPTGEIEFRGTLGNLYTGPNGEYFELRPSASGQFQNFKSPINEEKINSTEDPNGSMNLYLTQKHIRNFLDCVKSRQTPNCDLETGHRSTTFAHLANIALATKSRLEWNPVTETFENNDVANDLLHYDYRKPWKLG